MSRVRASRSPRGRLDRATDVADKPSLVAQPGRRREVLPAWVRRADRAIVQRLNRGEHHPRIDRGLRILSRAADRGLLWFGIEFSLAASGRWRAGIRSIASLLTASAVANLIGKRLFGGARPDQTLLPAAVAYSRAHTGAHRPSDVLGGAAIGPAAAGTSAWVARSARSGRRVAKPAAPAISMPALPKGVGSSASSTPSRGSEAK